MIRNRTAVTATVYSSMFFLGIVIAVVGAAARNIGLSTARIGYLVSIQNVGFMVGVVLAGGMADAFPKTRVMFLGSVILAAAVAGFYAVDVFAVNLAVMLVMGAGIGLYEGTSDSVLLDLYSGNESLYINVNHMFVTAGSLLVTAYLVFLQMSWRRSMVQAALAVGVLAVLFAVSRIESKTNAEPHLGRRIAGFAGKPAFIFSFFLLIIAVGTQLSNMGLMTTYLMNLRSHDQVTSKIVVILYLAGVGGGRVAVGYLTRMGGIYEALVLLFPVTGVLSLVFFAFDTGPAAYVLSFLMGLSLAGQLPLLIALVGLKFRDVAGTALGLMKLAIPVGGIVVPLLFSAGAELFGLGPSLMLFPILYLAATIGTLAGRRFLRTP